MTHSIERTIVEISAHFVGVLEHMEASIDRALAMLGESTNASRAYIFLFDSSQETMSNDYEWCSIGVTPERMNLQNLPKSIFPWWMEKLEKHDIILVENVDDMGDEAIEERRILQAQNIKSLVVMPLIAFQGLIGFIGLDNVEASLLWSNEEVALLKMASEILGSAFTRLHYEKDLKAKTIELERALEEQKRLQSQLIQQEKMAGIGVMASGIAHEMNNPLAIAMSNLEVLRDSYNMTKQNGMCEDFLEIYQETKEGLEKISKIVKNIMHFTRTGLESEGSYHLLKEITDEAMMMTLSLKSDAIDVENHVDSTCHLRGKRSDMIIVMMNVLINAYQAVEDQYFGQPGGKVIIYSRQSDKSLSICVEDNGCGVDPSLVPSLCDPFFTTKPEGIGTGLGLSTVYDIVVKKYKGRLIPLVKEEGGMIFEIIFEV